VFKWRRMRMKDANSKHGGNENAYKSLGRHLRNVVIDGRITLNCILNKQYVRVWSGII
jgi:hypothetical protein